jgi:hypothetical protein
MPTYGKFDVISGGSVRCCETQQKKNNSKVSLSIGEIFANKVIVIGVVFFLNGYPLYISRIL